MYKLTDCGYIMCRSTLKRLLQTQTAQAIHNMRLYYEVIKTGLCEVDVKRRVARSASIDTKTRPTSSTCDDHGMIRNIGMMAHVDAGKTTTTERMLYYSGFTCHMGEVDNGSTVMDYMDQERARGITITSAAISFAWDDYKINLIDTPGHVDFTMEVERSLCALDGAVAIIDASAGVEAQTKTVWDQADRYEVPRIVFLNKMDKPSANMEMCLTSLITKLNIKPLVLQIPIYQQSQFLGVVDLVTKQSCIWNPSSDGRVYNITNFIEKSPLADQAASARNKLVESVADLDDTVANQVLKEESYELVTAVQLHSALRRITLKRLGFPVLCGSSFCNTGVQLLMDAIIKYLPSPMEVKRKNAENYNGKLCALAFKIIYNKQRGFLTFLRLYRGTINQGQRLYNVNKDCFEKAGRLYVAYANDFREILKARAGSIIVVTGLKETITGDTIVGTTGLEMEATRRRYKTSNVENERYPLLGGIRVPEPVFFCSIEPTSLAYQKTLDFALECLKREDPSLKVQTDENGQTILSGMGELHLEIIQERIKKEHNVEAELGPLQVAYKESINNAVKKTTRLERYIGDSKTCIALTLSLHPDKATSSSSKVKLMYCRENQENLSKIKHAYMQAVENGVAMGLEHGPVVGFPVVEAQVGLHWLEMQPGSSLVLVASAARQCVTAALNMTTASLLEPYMRLEVTTQTHYLHNILGDLAQRRGLVLEIDSFRDEKVLKAVVPLVNMIKYSTVLRTITSGLATFTLEFDSYRRMTQHEQQKAIARVKGFSV